MKKIRAIVKKDGEYYNVAIGNRRIRIHESEAWKYGLRGEGFQTVWINENLLSNDDDEVNDLINLLLNESSWMIPIHESKDERLGAILKNSFYADVDVDKDNEMITLEFKIAGEDFVRIVADFEGNIIESSFTNADKIVNWTIEKMEEEND